MGIPTDLNAGLLVEFNEDLKFVIPPPSARAAVRTRVLMAELSRAEKANEIYRLRSEEREALLEEDPDLDLPEVELEYDMDEEKLAEKMGIADASSYDMNRDLLGPLHDQLLDKLNVEQFDIVTQAVYIWATGGRETAEEFLKDPTRRPNRAARRAKKRRKATSR